MLHTGFFDFEEFFDAPEQLPDYAILSHRWGSNEVSYHEFSSKAVENNERYIKIRKSCEFAVDRGLRYIWIDTCCIDKKSSAELSEAINSMFRWYAGARECFAYLADASVGGSFRESEWFQRGWTLQELLAPTKVCWPYTVCSRSTSMLRS